MPAVTFKWRYIPLRMFGPKVWMFTHFGRIGSWLYNRRLYYSWLSGVIRVAGFEFEWRCPQAIEKRTEYFEGLIDKEFPSAPIPFSG